MSQMAYLLAGAGVADAVGLRAAPGAVLILVAPGRRPVLLAAGDPASVASHPTAPAAQRIDLPNAVLLPGLVNAHTHLDLTHLGPLPYDPAQGFAGWAGVIIRGRHQDPAAIRASVADGVRRSLAGGVVAVGDIAGDFRHEPFDELHASPLLGVSFLESFGMGARQAAVEARLRDAIARLAAHRDHPRVALGLQPHATYTVGSHLYAFTALMHRAHNLPICTHLAENPPEREFVARGTGQFRALLERMNLWDDALLADIAQNRHPIDHLAPSLDAAPWLLAHVNDCPDAQLERLAASGSSVAYCPRSSAYFLNHDAFGPHRYRDMLAAGINVALGTDSVVNLPADTAHRMSTLDEMRFLFARDATHPRTLLAMATINGGRALGLDPSLFTLSGSGKSIAGVIAVDVAGTDPNQPPLTRVLQGSGGVKTLCTAVGMTPASPDAF